MKNTSLEHQYFERFCNLEQQRIALAEDLKELAKEAKSEEINVPAIRLAVKRHLEDALRRRKRVALENDVTTLLEAIGEFINTPLGESAQRSAQNGAETDAGGEQTL
jgi:uncharacterized protein (UPF0335 family)